MDRVVKVNADHKCIVRDIDVRVATSYPVSKIKPDQRNVTDKAKRATINITNKISATILHRDVRWLVALIPAEEKTRKVEWRVAESCMQKTRAIKEGKCDCFIKLMTQTEQTSTLCMKIAYTEKLKDCRE